MCPVPHFLFIFIEQLLSPLLKKYPHDEVPALGLFFLKERKF